MRLFIIRHGESTWNSRGIIQGNRNPHLSQKGRKQARLLARYLESCRLERIFSSNLRRAYQTAEIVAQRLNLPVEKMPQLKEIGLGIWQGKTLRGLDAKQKRLYERWVKAPSKVKVPGAEDIEVFTRRICQAFNMIIQSADEFENVAVVTHGGAICAFLSYVLKADIDRLLVSVLLDNAGVSVIEVFEKKYFWVRAINYTAHLSPDGAGPSIKSFCNRLAGKS